MGFQSFGETRRVIPALPLPRGSGTRHLLARRAVYRKQLCVPPPRAFAPSRPSTQHLDRQHTAVANNALFLLSISARAAADDGGSAAASLGPNRGRRTARSKKPRRALSFAFSFSFSFSFSYSFQLLSRPSASRTVALTSRYLSWHIVHVRPRSFSVLPDFSSLRYRSGLQCGLFS